MPLFTRLITLPITLYQWLISPWLGGHCRFEPTCSHYAKEALLKHGIIKGSWLALRRIGRCQPWGGAGFDPVPAARKEQE